MILSTTDDKAYCEQASQPMIILQDIEIGRLLSHPNGKQGKQGPVVKF